jgi:hypothetical protein
MMPGVIGTTHWRKRETLAMGRLAAADTEETRCLHFEDGQGAPGLVEEGWVCW